MILYMLTIYFMGISKNVLETALWFALFVILIGLELISKNYILSGLILITVYVGAVIILMVFMMMNLDFNEVEYSSSLISNILIFLLFERYWKEDFISWSYNTDFNLQYLLGDELMGENPLNMYLLLLLLLLSLVCSIRLS